MHAVTQALCFTYKQHCTRQTSLSNSKFRSPGTEWRLERVVNRPPMFWQKLIPNFYIIYPDIGTYDFRNSRF